jgi:hypothetical protein
MMMTTRADCGRSLRHPRRRRHAAPFYLRHTTTTATTATQAQQHLADNAEMASQQPPGRAFFQARGNRQTGRQAG